MCVASKRMNAELERQGAGIDWVTPHLGGHLRSTVRLSLRLRLQAEDRP